jgi:type VI protein secretion system component Hcp
MPVAPAQRVLALQRQAGNRAVAALLARKPAPPKTPPVPPEVLKGNHVIIPKVGTIPLESISWGASSGGKDDPAPKLRVQDVHVITELGPHSQDLMLAVANGSSLGTVEIVLVHHGKPYMRLKLTKARVTSYSVSGHLGDRAPQGKLTESWSMVAEKFEAEATPQTAEDRWE